MADNNCGCGCNDEMDDIENIITLVDEDGTEADFVCISTVGCCDNTYAILLPVEQDDDDCEEREVAILKVELNDDGDETLVAEEDDEIINKVFELFLEQQGAEGCDCDDDCCCGEDGCDGCCH